MHTKLYKEAHYIYIQGRVCWEMKGRNATLRKALVTTLDLSTLVFHLSWSNIPVQKEPFDFERFLNCTTVMALRFHLNHI